MSLRYYAPLSDAQIEIEGETIPVSRKQHAIPILLVPPLGVYAWVFDLLVRRSFIRYLLAHGYRVYLVDWGEPTAKDAHLALEDYVIDWLPKAIEHMRKHAFQDSSTDGVEDQPITLLGYCMGGLLSLLYTAAFQDKNIVNLITIASPIDFHQNSTVVHLSSVLARPISLAQKITGPTRLKRLRHRLYHLRGNAVSTAFRLTNPMLGVRRYLDLVRNMADREYVIAYMSMSEWFGNMTDFPGATLEEVMDKFGVHNELARGKVPIGDKIADFSAIESRLLSIAGENDAIVSLGSAERILDLVGSNDKTFHSAPGGHAGVFGGRSAGTQSWQLCERWLSRRSG